MTDEATNLIDRKLAAARLWATNEFPYLASAIFAATTVPTEGLGRLSVDRWWRIQADPEVVANASVEQLGGELVHLSTHMLREHASRAEDQSIETNDELHHWVDAADAEINDDVPPGMPRVSEVVAPEDLDAPDGKLVEEYYRSAQPRVGSANDCGSGAHGRTSPFDLPPPSDSHPDGLSEQEQDLVRRAVAADINSADGVPAGLRAWADAHLVPKVPWRVELAALLRSAVSTASGAVDYSYSRPSRRNAAVPGVVLATMRSPAIEVAVICDTSASVSEDLLAAAVTETDGLLRAIGSRGVRFLACDDSVRGVSRIVDSPSIQLIGGGGTDMGAGLEAAADTRPTPQVIVVLTDGFTPWPSAPPRASVVIGVLATDDGIAVPPTPQWARTVHIGT